MMFLHRYDGVGLPWRKTIGSPSPTSTYAMVVSRTVTRFRNATASVEIARSVSGFVMVSGLMTSSYRCSTASLGVSGPCLCGCLAVAARKAADEHQRDDD